MCKWGDTTELYIEGVRKHIDKCIVSIVEAVNDAGLNSIASCCGHGKQMGNIALKDGRGILIVPNYEIGREIGKLFPPINPQGEE